MSHRLSRLDRLHGMSYGQRPGAQVAQLVEHATENRSVGGSIPPLGIAAPGLTQQPPVGSAMGSTIARG
jgi:hypothetical protein